MHPYDHARSSARTYGGVWQDYHPLHAWFDATKSLLCRFTHRALRHHVEGVREAMALFGDTIENSDGVKISTMSLGLQHLAEDAPRAVDAKEWLVGFTPPDWLPAATPTAHELAAASAMRFGGTAEDYLPLHAWFLATSQWMSGTNHLAFRHHAFGVFEAEARFGAVLPLTGGTCVPTRVAAERHVQDILGRVPPATEFLKRIAGQRWMLQATSARRLGLDASVPCHTLEVSHEHA